GATGLGPPGGSTVAGPPDPQAERQGLGPPRQSDRHRVTRHDSGLRVNWHDRGHWVRHWIVWLDSGHRVTRHQVHLARQRAPRHLARQWAPSHQARQRAPGHQVPDRLARQQ
ncbi:unnamed protein product, partial [Staurois parvus]